MTKWINFLNLNINNSYIHAAIEPKYRRLRARERLRGCFEAGPEAPMSWRIFVWMVGVIVLMAHVPLFIEPSHPNVVAAARDALRYQTLAAVLSPLSPATRGPGLWLQIRSPQA